MSKYIFSGNLTDKMVEYLKRVPEFEPIDVLVSQLDRSSIDQMIRYKEEGVVKSLFIDSGAYSHYTGKVKYIDVDEYIEYVESYYKDLFDNPNKLIAEMEEVMKLTDEKIIEWLYGNSEEYIQATDERREQMRQDWQEMIDSMRGVTETYNKEIESLMGMTDEEIIDWLRRYNLEFQTATEEQQQSFLKSWKDTLEEWRNAYKSVMADTSIAGNSGSTNGSGIDSSNYVGTAIYRYLGPNGKWATVTANGSSAISKSEAISKAVESARVQAITLSKISNGDGYRAELLQSYQTGGLNTQTGLAWLDGTKARPERILSPYQTELFEDMLSTLHEIRMIRVGGMHGYYPYESGGTSASFTIENIEVNVSSMASDADYEEVAERVGEAIKNRIMRGSSIGGFSIR